ncbi:hypothetical protein BT93_K1542 [Corymbia citriodora subsp. variegata]|nr:hypothetical protein BT93_K1542 [Corymbia citriodora subsp. variegata]
MVLTEPTWAIVDRAAFRGRDGLIRHVVAVDCAGKYRALCFFCWFSSNGCGPTCCVRGVAPVHGGWQFG